MDKTINISKTLYAASLVLLVFWGAHAWFTWWLDYLPFISNTILRLSLAIIALFYANSNGIRIKLNQTITIGVICFILAVNIPFRSVGELLAQIILFIPIFVLIFDKDNSEQFLKIISISICVVLVPGIILYFIRTFGQLTIMGVPTQYGDGDRGNTYFFMNYGFMLVRTWINDDIRFTSVFLEPGYFGSLVAFLLYANNYNFKKKYNIILLSGLILSFSLAGYIISFIGYILYSVSQKKKVRKLIFFGVFCFLAVQFFGSYKSGNNMVNELILDRLQYDEVRVIQGNDRSSDDLNFAFDKLIASGNVLFGDPSVKGAVGAGYKKYLVERGLLSALFFFVFYYNVAISSRDRKYSIFFFILVLLTFLQAAFPNSYSWLIPYILGINKNDC